MDLMNKLIFFVVVLVEIEMSDFAEVVLASWKKTGVVIFSVSIKFQQQIG